MGKSSEWFLSIREKEAQVDDSDFKYQEWQKQQIEFLIKNNKNNKKKKNGSKKSGIF